MTFSMELFIAALKKIQKSITNKAILFFHFIRYVIAQFFKDNCFESASALTYTSLLSLVPFMAVSVFLMQGIPYFQDLWNDTQQFIFNHFVPATGREVQKYLHEFIRNTGRLSILGVLFLVFSAMVLIFTIEQTFNRIWSVKSSRSMVGSFLIYWSVLTLLPILMGLSFGVSSYLWSLPLWQDTAKQLGLINYILFTMPFLLTWLCFTLIYVIIPNCRVNKFHALIGAFVVAVLFEASKKLFAGYVASINMNALLYGAFATIPFFLLWMYISWFIILFGAQMVNAMDFYNFVAPRASEWRFVQSYKWLVILWQAQQQGISLSARELFYKEGRMTAAEPFIQLGILEKKGWIRKTAGDQYILSKDLSNYTLFDLYSSLPWRLPKCEQINAKEKITKLLKKQLTEIDHDMKNKLKKSLSDNFRNITSQ